MYENIIRYQTVTLYGTCDDRITVMIETDECQRRTKSPSPTLEVLRKGHSDRKFLLNQGKMSENF
jgi:hypothetical protein